MTSLKTWESALDHSWTFTQSWLIKTIGENPSIQILKTHQHNSWSIDLSNKKASKTSSWYSLSARLLPASRINLMRLSSSKSVSIIVLVQVSYEVLENAGGTSWTAVGRLCTSRFLLDPQPRLLQDCERFLVKAFKNLAKPSTSRFGGWLLETMEESRLRQRPAWTV